MKANDSLPRESTINSRKKYFAEFSGGIKSVFCNSTMCGVCLCAYVYAFIYLYLDYIEFFASHIKKKKESNPVTVKMPTDGVSIHVDKCQWEDQSTLCSGCPLLRGPARVTLCCSRFYTPACDSVCSTSCSVSFLFQDTLLFLLAAKPGWMARLWLLGSYVLYLG